jgi:hypothetical protein
MRGRRARRGDLALPLLKAINDTTSSRFESATLLTGAPWRYVKVLQMDVGKLQPAELSDVVLAFLTVLQD